MNNDPNQNFNYSPAPQFQQPAPAPIKDNSKTALIFGIVGLALPVVTSFFSCCPPVGSVISVLGSIAALVFSILAMVMGIKARKLTTAMYGKPNGMATAGMILGIVGLALAVIGFICGICAVCALCTGGSVLGGLLSDPSIW